MEEELVKPLERNQAGESKSRSTTLDSETDHFEPPLILGKRTEREALESDVQSSN